MRELPRLPDGASADEKIKIIYDWLYELQMELQAERDTPLSQAEPASSPEGEPLKE